MLRAASLERETYNLCMKRFIQRSTHVQGQY